MCLLCLLHWHVGSLLLPHLGRWEFLGNFGIIWKRIYKIVKGFTGILYNNFNHIIFLEKYRKHPKLTKSGEGKETCYNSNHLQPEQHDQTCPIHTLYVLKYGYIYWLINTVIHQMCNWLQIFIFIVCMDSNIPWELSQALKDESFVGINWATGNWSFSLCKPQHPKHVYKFFWVGISIYISEKGRIPHSEWDLR